MVNKDFYINLGNFIEGEPLEWPIFMEGNNKMAIIGEEQKRKKAYYNIEKQLLELDSLVYFKLNCDSSDRVLENTGTIVNITEFEKSPEKSIPNQTLAKHRKDFVNVFMKLMLEKVGVSRSDLTVSYRPTMEGPLQGYLKAASVLNGQKLLDFEKEIELLDEIMWEYEGDLLQYRINEDRIESRHLELLKGIWSFWVFAMLSPADMTRVVHVSLPGTTDYNEEQLIELDIMLEALENLANISDTILMISTDSIIPIKPRSIRYKLMVSNDADLKGTQLEFDDQYDSFMVIDDVYKNLLKGKFNF